MKTIKILGVDPSLRNTGLSIVSFKTEMQIDNPKAYKVTNCQTLSNPQKYTGKDAILNMLDMIKEESLKECYLGVDNVIIESPAVIFNKAWSAGTMSSIAHISGGCIALLGIEKVQIFRPNEWNKTRKKDVTHNNAVSLLGDYEKWHYEKKVKSDKYMEHILDAASMALWWIKSNYEVE